MIDHNTRRVFLSFLIIVFLTFYPCFRQVTSDSSKGATVMIVLAIVLLLLYRVLFLSVVSPLLFLFLAGHR
jgi:branched-subunit amino acid transport protein AzlD